MDRKEAILRLLKARGEASLAEIAGHLELSKQGALRHLEALAAQGLIAVETREHAGGPGRPEHSYRLSPASAGRFPNSQRELATELVSFMETGQLSRFFQARSDRLETEYASRLSGLNSEARVRELARLATEHGHMAEVIEREDGSLVIRQFNCPIQEVAARTGHPCHAEQEMYGRLLGADVVRESWMGANASTCTYVVKGSKRSGEVTDG